MDTTNCTLYEILRIEASASMEEVRRAYKQRALETHPDKLDPGATEQQTAAAIANFRKVHEAFTLLSDPQRRLAYDIRMKIRGDTSKWRSMSDEHIARMKDREEWARKQEEEHQLRMAEIREQNRRIREQNAMRMRQAKVQATIVQTMLEELCDLELHPEWQARKRALQQRRSQPNFVAS